MLQVPAATLPFTCRTHDQPAREHSQLGMRMLLSTSHRLSSIREIRLTHYQAKRRKQSSGAHLPVDRLAIPPLQQLLVGLFV